MRVQGPGLPGRAAPRAWGKPCRHCLPHDLPRPPPPAACRTIPPPVCSRWANFKFLGFLQSANTDPFVAWLVVTGDATPDGIRDVRSVLGAISFGVKYSGLKGWRFRHPASPSSASSLSHDTTTWRRVSIQGRGVRVQGRGSG